MIVKNVENVATLNELKWDTEFFGVTSARVDLKHSLTLNEWDELKHKFKDYQFVSIVNHNSEPINAQLIGKDTKAFVADVNIQFVKRIEDINELPLNITIHRALKKNDQILEIANFQFSKFTEDPELAVRGGDQVYRQWLMNAFNKRDKFYALSKGEDGNINGFILFSFSDHVCVIELISVNKSNTKGLCGSNLFKAVEYVAHQLGINEIKVGTQLRNIGAINFYHKVGCKQVGCHQVFHLWNW